MSGGWTARAHRLAGAAGCALALLSACATVSVSTDYDRNVDFSRYHTFQIAGGHLVHEGMSDDANTLVKDRIAAALRGALAAKGLQEKAGDADLDVGYYGGARTRTEVEGMPAYGPGPGFGPFWAGAYAQAESQVPVSDQKIREAVDQAFRNFPPRK
jgi:hypothetical protein